MFATTFCWNRLPLALLEEGFILIKISRVCIRNVNAFRRILTRCFHSQRMWKEVRETPFNCFVRTCITRFQVLEPLTVSVCHLENFGVDSSHVLTVYVAPYPGTVVDDQKRGWFYEVLRRVHCIDIFGNHFF